MNRLYNTNYKFFPFFVQWNCWCCCLFFTLGIGVNISRKECDPLIVLDQIECEQVSKKKINDETVYTFFFCCLFVCVGDSFVVYIVCLENVMKSLWRIHDNEINHYGLIDVHCEQCSNRFYVWISLLPVIIWLSYSLLAQICVSLKKKQTKSAVATSKTAQCRPIHKWEMPPKNRYKTAWAFWFEFALSLRINARIKHKIIYNQIAL